LVNVNALIRVTLLLALGASACSVMLSIEDAHVDATLEGGPVKAGSAGAEAAQAGSASSGGKVSSLAGSSPSEAGTSSEGEAGGAAGGAMTAPEPTLCERYCTLVIASCSGQLEQYRTLNQCLQVCQRLPAGVAGDENVNTVECRMRQAQFAESEPLSYCKSAGPLGQNKCGSNCASYCSLMQASCTPASTAGNLEPSYYLDDKACLAACDELTPGPDDPTAYSSSRSAVPSSYVGNNVFCRTYHVAAGLEQAAEDEHCPHAMGGEPCTAQ
jgi:hypothetical protein